MHASRISSAASSSSGSARWQNKVVDAPSPFRSNSAPRRSVDAANKYSRVDLPGPSYQSTTDLAAAAATPSRRSQRASVVVAASPGSASQRKLSFEAAASLLCGDEVKDRYSRRMASPPRRSTSPGMTEVLSPNPTRTKTDTAPEFLFSKRMSPQRNMETTTERKMATAKTDLDPGRGRLHSPAHRNYVDTVRVALHSASTNEPTASVTTKAAGVIGVAGSMRPRLKNSESAKTDEGHWRPSISKRCVSPRPSLIGVMHPEPREKARPYRLVPPYGLSVS